MTPIAHFPFHKASFPRHSPSQHHSKQTPHRPRAARSIAIALFAFLSLSQSHLNSPLPQHPVPLPARASRRGALMRPAGEPAKSRSATGPRTSAPANRAGTNQSPREQGARHMQLPNGAAESAGSSGRQLLQKNLPTSPIKDRVFAETPRVAAARAAVEAAKANLRCSFYAGSRFF
jgi:hypothetical protein